MLGSPPQTLSPGFLAAWDFFRRLLGIFGSGVGRRSAVKRLPGGQGSEKGFMGLIQHVCVCVCVSVCMHVCMYACMYACMQTNLNQGRLSRVIEVHC